MWTLISLERLPRRNGHGVLNMLDAMKINEMADLGDLQVATTPPLTWRVLTDPTQPRKVDSSGEVVFAIGDFEFYCGNRRIEDEQERNLAFYFMLYGDWEEEGEPEAYIENGNLIHFDFVVSHPAPTGGQQFEILGSLSGMISRRFKDLTAPEATIERLVPSAEPGSLGIVIPKDYKGERLPLWRFTLKPNYD